jgi:hypothetical protein
MVIRRRPRETWKHTRWTYRRRAMTHYAQAAVAAVPIIVGLVTLSVMAALLLVLAGELLVFVLLPHVPGFRKQVDAMLDRDACLRAATSRALLLSRMDVHHQRELERLEDLAGRVRMSSALDEDGATSEEEWLGLDGLLAVFVRLAIAHRDSSTAFHSTGGFEIEVQIAEVEELCAKTSEDERAWAERRLAILHDRRQTWRRARMEQNVLASELATISELVQWMYEQSALGRCVDAHSDVVAAVTTAAKSGAVLRELAALDGSEPVDPEVLRLGRRGALENLAAAQASLASTQVSSDGSSPGTGPHGTPQALAC